MRPGLIKWAINDTFVAGPDIGDYTKFAPTTLLQEDGRYRGFKPGPDTHNWILNRFGLLQQETARMSAGNLTREDDALAAHNSGLASYCYDQANGIRTVFVHNAGGGLVNEFSAGSAGLQNNWTTATAVLIGGAVISNVDSTATAIGRRWVVIDDAADNLRDSSNGAPWTTSVTWAPGPPTKFWVAIGNDKDTNGAGYSRIIIGDDGAGPVPPVLYYSINATTFSPVSTFPILAAGRVIRSVSHSNHQVGALGPDDAGNPSWLVMTDVEALKSPNGTTGWTQANHGLGVMTSRSVAYSRSSRRWVCMMAAAGSVGYSDDNGATWTTLAGALVAYTGPAIGSARDIVCDGYGTFVCSDGVRYWISTDEGLTWTASSYIKALLAQSLLGVDCDSSIDVDQAPRIVTGFTHIFSPGTGPAIEAYHSLRS